MIINDTLKQENKRSVNSNEGSWLSHVWMNFMGVKHKRILRVVYRYNGNSRSKDINIGIVRIDLKWCKLDNIEVKRDWKSWRRKSQMTVRRTLWFIWVKFRLCWHLSNRRQVTRGSRINNWVTYESQYQILGPDGRQNWNSNRNSKIMLINKGRFQNDHILN